MYYLGLHFRWVQLAGIIVSIVGGLLFALLIALFASETAVRSIGAMVLLAFGIVLTLRALLPRRLGGSRNG